VAQDTQKLLEVSIKGEALAIKRLSQSVRDNKARIEKHFAELETVTNEHDAKAKEFDQQLSEMAEIS
jgi:flagellar capping protein FliD